MTGVLAALGAAIAWTAASGMWRSLSTVGPAWLLNVLKNSLATLCFLPVLLSIPWGQSGSGLIWLLFSGAVGIALGDTFYLLALRRLGTRRTLTVESIGPVLASIGSVVLMGEVLAPAAWIGACCVTAAVVLVAKRGSSVGAADPFGLICSCFAVLCGLTGAFLARHVLTSSSLLPIQTAPVRLLGGWLCLATFSSRVLKSVLLTSRVQAGVVVAAVLLGTNLGIVLQQFVFKSLPVGLGVSLMSTAPVFALLISPIEGERLQGRDGWAAALAVTGVALTVMAGSSGV